MENELGTSGREHGARLFQAGQVGTKPTTVVGRPVDVGSGRGVLGWGDRRRRLAV